MSIAVGGLGIVSALGIGLRENLEALKAGRSGIKASPVLLETRHRLPVGELTVTNGELGQLLQLPSVERISRTALLGAVAVKEALESSGLRIGEDLKADRIGLINATSVGGMDLSEDFYRKWMEDPENADAELCRMHDCAASTGFIASLLGIKGFCTTISTACSSSANSIMLAARLIEAGVLDAAVAGGCDALSRFTLNGFKSLGILSDEICRPFEEERKGLNLGEGAGFLLLCRKELLRNGALAWYAGGANANDAHHQTASSESGEGAFLCMEKALEDAGLKPADISYVNAHGTGTRNNDSSEYAALCRIFPDGLPAFSSTKNFTGHTLAAAGGIEAVFSVLSLRDGSRSHVMSNSFGFGGNCSSLIFSAKEKRRNEDAQERKPAEAYIELLLDDSGVSRDIKELVPDAGMRRRMGKLLRQAVGTAAELLGKSACVPDAIITATGLGCLADSEKFLQNIVRDSEELLNPTPFIQSTFNTVGGQIALMGRNHCYNLTYVDRGHSFEAALTDALLLVRENKARKLLLGAFDENIELSVEIMRRLGIAPQKEGSVFALLSAEKTENSIGRIRLRTCPKGPGKDGSILSLANAMKMEFDLLDVEWFG